jgi:hypothetical protein
MYDNRKVDRFGRLPTSLHFDRPINGSALPGRYRNRKLGVDECTTASAKSALEMSGDGSATCTAQSTTFDHSEWSNVTTVRLRHFRVRKSG